MPFVYSSCYCRSFIVYFGNLIKETQINYSFAKKVPFYWAQRELIDEKANCSYYTGLVKLVSNVQFYKRVFLLWKYFLLIYKFPSQGHFKFMTKANLVEIKRELFKIIRVNEMQGVFRTPCASQMFHSVLFHFQPA